MRRAVLASLAIAALALPLAGEYPAIGSLSAKDPLYKQLTEDIAQANIAMARKKPLPPLSIYRYVLPAPAELITLASELSLPYEALATLNRIGRAGVLPKGYALLVPGAAGVFAPERAGNDLERFLLASRRPEEGSPLAVRAGGKAVAFRFYPGDRFRPTERAFFLNALYRFPLATGTLTSSFGYRLHPLTGEPGMHTGIDLAAPLGAEVYAARDGKVVAAGYDAALGNYVEIDHGGGWSSRYGHLSKILVALRDAVESGTIIGAVGSTGISTGPHLHFEIRSKGEPRDPAAMMPGKK